MEVLLSDLRKAVVALINAGDELPNVCWLINDRDGEQSEELYCRACAKKVIDWLVTGESHGEVSSDNAPDWSGLTRDDIFLYEAFEVFESDGDICALCSSEFDVSLTHYGVERELEHYESVQPEDMRSNDWLCMLNVIDSVCEDSENKEAQELYHRAIKCVHRLLPKGV